MSKKQNKETEDVIVRDKKKAERCSEIEKDKQQKSKVNVTAIE